ncbi:hypothetical protein DYBT9623_04074 [Dyadobacter sp. CECT 9623]|uniref:Uncharacterized protein n=1 Tax=Dyadobacter linearis TaxID=2823330 RepID=A0ABM8UUR4_9BACT|nr:hypothetical protein DYBT9623_04074 [Dyadobacter sp. CECT 9623]
MYPGCSILLNVIENLLRAFRDKFNDLITQILDPSVKILLFYIPIQSITFL